MLNFLSENPFTVLYLLQAAIYVAAAIFVWREEHAKLTQCYVASAMLHGLFGACHALHFN